MFFSFYNRHEYWIGLKKKGSSREWIDHTTHSSSSWSVWQKNEPNSDSDKNCVVMSANHNLYWKMKPCSQSKPFVCQLIYDMDNSCTDSAGKATTTITTVTNAYTCPNKGVYDQQRAQCYWFVTDNKLKNNREEATLHCANDNWNIFTMESEEKMKFVLDHVVTNDTTKR